MTLREQLFGEGLPLARGWHLRIWTRGGYTDRPTSWRNVEGDLHLVRGHLARTAAEEKATPYRHIDLVRTWWSALEKRGDLSDRIGLELYVSNGEHAGAGVDWHLLHLVRGGVKLCLPRELIAPWVLEKRATGFEVGPWKFGLKLLREDDHGGMRRYYAEKLHRGEPRPSHVGRWALVPGLAFDPNPYRLKTRVLGEMVRDEVDDETGTTVVPMPEGNYPARWTRYTTTRYRARFPRLTRQVETWVRLDTGGIPEPGKGEDSWNIDDDALMSCSGRTLALAVGQAVSSVLRQRHRYAGPDWVPDAGWPEGIAR